MIKLGLGTVQVEKNWTAFKALVASKSLSMQYDEDDSAYYLFAVEGTLVFSSTIWKAAAQVPGIPAGNDADRTDFETSYKSSANATVITKIEGQVFITSPTPPPSTTAISISADTPLAISTDQTVEYTISNNKTFYLQQIIAGSEGDSTEKGSCVEVSYFDGTTERIIERVYLNGFTTSISLNNVNKSRDGTAMTGNGSTKKIRVKRRRLSGSSQEVDAVIRGYEL